eukprot:4548278-Pleurochrysis_carterae.AAC.1
MHTDQVNAFIFSLAAKVVPGATHKAGMRGAVQFNITVLIKRLAGALNAVQQSAAAGPSNAGQQPTAAGASNAVQRPPAAGPSNTVKPQQPTVTGPPTRGTLRTRGKEKMSPAKFMEAQRTRIQRSFEATTVSTLNLLF